MKNLYSKIVLTAALAAGVTLTKAQFSGPYAVANWGTVQVNSDGITNIGGAPASITMISGDNQSGNQGTNDFTITIPQSGLISFNWAYSTGDDPDYDYPQYMINGIPTVLTAYNTAGSLTQSGSENCIIVNQGDEFALSMYTADNVFGPGTTIFSGFTFSPGISVTPTSVAICPGDMITLTASGGSTYNWPSGIVNGVPFVGPNGTTTFVVTSFIGTCNSYAAVNVSVFPGPNLAISGGPGTICSGTPVTLTVTGANSYLWNSGAVTTTISGTPAITTTYVVVGTVGTCTALATESVIVNPTPTLAVSGPTAICKGSTASVTASGASTYAWTTFDQTANVSLSPAATSTYGVLGTTNGCSGTATYTLVVNPLPAVLLSSNKATSCAGDAVILTASGANSYSWTNFSTVTTGSISVTPTLTTTYIVSGFDGNGCSAQKTYVQIVTICAGIEVQEADNFVFTMYPNPASSTVVFKSEKDLREIQVTDVSGKLVLNQVLRSGENSITIEHLNNGIYFVIPIFNNGESNNFKKLIINK